MSRNEKPCYCVLLEIKFECGTKTTATKLTSMCAYHVPSSCQKSHSSSAHGEVASVTGHLLDAREGRARDLVAANGRVDADEDTGLVDTSASRFRVLHMLYYSRR